MNSPKTLNYKALFDEGIEHIEALSSDIWTDYNSHDPGVTVLEFLCYALTDLGARASLPMTTLLAEKLADLSVLPPNLPRAHEILPCRPLTIDDYRRLLIDIDGVRNAWLHTTVGDHAPMHVDDDGEKEKLTFESDEEEIKLKGFYEVDIEFVKTLPQKQKEDVLRAAHDRLMANRNLCEDFVSIDQVQEEDLAVCLDVELHKEADVDEAMAEILYALDEFISPTLRFYSLEEMLAKGKRIEDVLRGPMLAHGFLEDAELEASRDREEIRASDVIQLLMDIPQVAAVKRLLFTTRIDDDVIEMDVANIIKLTKGRAIRFDTDNSRILFFKEQVPYIGVDANVEHHLTQIRQRHYQPPIQEKDLRLTDPKALSVALEQYTSIQHHFPLNYGIGIEGLPNTASAQRKASAKQLKAFLLLFEQFLADYLMQLKNARRLLDSRPVERSYFTQKPDDVPDVDELVQDLEDVADYHETDEVFEVRRNRFLDHLLARFGEQYREYGVLADTVYGNDARLQLIKDKERILANITVLNRDRATARDYTHPEDPLSMAGLERRLRTFLGYPTDTDVSADQMKAFEIYQEEDDDDIDEFRFRLLDDEDEIMLSGTKRFLTIDACKAEMREVPEFGVVSSNYQVLETEDNRYYFALFNDEADMIARRIEYFYDEAECKAERDRCIDYLKELQSDNRLYVLEHILLRPHLSDGIDPTTVYVEANDESLLLPICDDGMCTDDPYSFRITVVMPAWPKRFEQMRFRSYVERFIREQTPAHIYAKVCWVTEEDMDRFGRAYEIWKTKLVGLDSTYPEAAEQLIDVWRTLRNVYPRVHIHDCTMKEDITPAILGHSALGTSSGDYQ